MTELNPNELIIQISTSMPPSVMKNFRIGVVIIVALTNEGRVLRADNFKDWEDITPPYRPETENEKEVAKWGV